MAGILFVSKANHLRDEDYRVTVREAAIASAVTQLRPRLMTMLLALLGLIPATMASGVGSDVQRPLATVMVGACLRVTLSVNRDAKFLYFGNG
ncbi:RND transporter, Hydrophobe/Amphiphile Efflux-1 (HAE1)/Heavy Metal Efflux (HME) family, permease protein [Leptospira weilii serovar Ranarum str. ICFT]|uniref:RND transporter, Hydrophobe/Amphiphile Efflux-1 (HAE1)/Heavy Metal Efflux (HME) family, permease protein n=1 Tax=Leptospira weilii serovar Ranarum str. ICFT TaxID=1218598 RepID=N1WLX3_9LEPT|nr:RND transporter, Hydrophobe/Amphiphile Efflux-1 (HAE1)/Heavy Metal Efflux (HME) family, permease protein [Leptospira weilii serovar Ranarum str. ICFT]